MQDTASNIPPQKTSPEASQEELRLARQQGDAYKQALDYITQKQSKGETVRAGDYLIGYVIEKAEGLYHRENGQLKWVPPQKGENVHIEITVQDSGDLRFIPGLTIMLTVLDERGGKHGTRQLPFLWHPWLYHYGLNWEVPEELNYTLRVHIEPPDFMRHDKVNGDRYQEPVEVEFLRVHIVPGQKKS